jgi:uncharacterized protein (TIGR02145 family)
MKRTITLLIASFLAISSFSQQSLCKRDTIHLYHTNYRGKLSWLVSDNGTDWSRLPGSQKDTLMIIATNPAYYRTEVIEGICRPYYSDVIHLIVNELPPVMLQLTDSVCLNETAFVLNGGSPSGGSYYGDGVLDGKFIPALAGIGRHTVFYRYSDPQTRCTDSTFALITVSPVANHALAGNDLTLIPADSVMLDGNIPENSTGTWTLITGSFGHFSDIHAPKAWFIKESTNLNFTLRWSISGKCGNSSDDINISFFPLSKNPCPNAPTVTDADGNVYPTIQIGDQCWMAKNLNVGRFVPSTVSSVEHSNLYNNGVIEKYCLHNSIDSCNLYGGLYDWDEAMGYSDIEGARGICPEGWHIPTYGDWNILDARYAWGQAGLQIKVGGNSGFEGYYAGDRHSQGEFYSNGSSGFFWVSGSFVFELYNDGYLREIAACNGLISTNHFNKKTGLSVRCIKNNF